MKRKWIAILMTLALVLTLAACGAGEETTLTGMVVAVEGTVLSLVEMDGEFDMEFAEGERPQMPEGMENFEDFDPEAFDGTLPEGMEMPQWEEGEMPEGMQMPEGMELPEDMELPEGMTMPEDGQMPDFSGEAGGMGPGFGSFSEDMETTDVDIADAHISLEIDGGKASGSLEDIAPGSSVTVTLNKKGEATYVLVSSQSFAFGGGRGAN